MKKVVITMCKKCGNANCCLGEKCGNLETQSMLIEDGTMQAFNLHPYDSKVEVPVNEDKK